MATQRKRIMESSIETQPLTNPDEKMVHELEQSNKSLRSLLLAAQSREKKLALALQDFGVNVSLIDVETASNGMTGTHSSGGSGRDNGMIDCAVLYCPLEPPGTTFCQSLFDRGGWLVGLLIFQSCSSFILSNNEELIRDHPSIVFFLTMLVGAGGNAGNQAAVRVIRGIAVGALNEHTTSQFIIRELIMAFSLSSLLGATGLLRAFLSAQTSLPETVAITITLMIIVFISIVTGALLPLLLQQCRLDPAHSSTSIQVIMDISGVLLTCSVSRTLLDTNLGRFFLAKLGVFGV